MKKSSILLLVVGLITAGIFFPSVIKAQTIPEPETYFGYKPGSDRKLFDYDELISYLKLLDQASERCKMTEIGTSPLGKKLHVFLISSPENLANLDRLKEINQRLSMNVDLQDADLEKLTEEGRVFVVATMSMHSNEVAPSQSVPLMAYELAVTNDPQQLQWLKNTVLMIVPSHNPDGMDMVVEHYRKYLGTKYEKTSMPGVYHKYIGHDNNRDFITLTQSDNLAISRLFSHEWFPQVMVEKHQMGASGVRYFVPPPHDPIAENIDAGLLNWIGVFGSHMMQRMTSDSLKGVTQRYLYDDYWPGHTETCLWKNTIGMLTEAASVYHASPVYIEPQEISVYGKGLSEYKKSINMPDPWPGGWWRLSDIVNYEISSLWGMMETASGNKKQILRFRNELTQKMVRLGKTTAPYFYILPAKQQDVSELNHLISLMHTHGVKVFRINENMTLGGKTFSSGDVVIPLAQPFRAFIKEVMEKQNFPLRHYTPGGQMIEPYDITSWSLPLHFGLECYEINQMEPKVSEQLSEINDLPDPVIPDSKWGYVLDVRQNESYKAAFLLLGKGQRVLRLNEPLQMNETKFGIGSFIIPFSSVAKEVLQSLNMQTVGLDLAPEVDATAVKMPSIGLVETWFHDMDAGWTRYIFDTYGVPFQVLHPDELAKGVPAGIDVLVFPNASKSVLLEGKYGEENDYYIANYPAEYTKGMGKDGLNAVMKWVDAGGIVASWGQSTELFTGQHQIENSEKQKESFRLPFKNIGPELVKQGLYVPGTLMKLKLVRDHPLTVGMQETANIFSRGTPVFTTSLPNFDMDRRIIGSYTENEIVVSGFAKNENLVAKKAALIWLQKGKGQLVLFGFNPQFRSSTTGTYKLLFNTLLLPAIK